MKITAEFNSNEELLSFIGAFGAKSFTPDQSVANTVSVVNPIITGRLELPKDAIKESVLAPVGTQDKPIKETKVDAPKGEIKETVPTKETETTKEDTKEETKITKEMVRKRLGVIMKSGKQAEVKALVAKHGASKLPDLKEEEYATVYQEAEVLL